MTRRRRTVATFAALAAAVFVFTPAAADWTASGTFRYQDREWDSNGFTGTVVERPIRFADVEVIDPDGRGKNATLAKGVTDANGQFNLFVPDNSRRTVYVRVLTTSGETSDLYVEVTTHGGTPYALRSADIPDHGRSTDVDFGVLVAAAGSGGEAFNMFDLLVYGADYIASVTGSRPNKRKDGVTLEWELDGGVTGAAYTWGTTIVMRDYAAYDDTVVLHEWGHYAMNVYSGSNNPGGTHYLSDCNQDGRLAFDEGRASALGCGVRRLFGMPSANVYLRTSGAAGPGGVQNWFDLEDEVQYACDGSTSEVTVARSLWDINDDAATTDTTPGVDDAHDTLARPDAETWDVLDHTLGWPYLLEDFWDGWFQAGNGFLGDMEQVFGFLDVNFHPDAGEPNGTTAEADWIFANGPALDLTFFSDPDGDGIGGADTDVFRFGATSGTAYVIETGDLLSGADTRLELIDTDGSTVLASNDDVGTGNPASRIQWTAPGGGTYYIRVTNLSALEVYGSYSLSLTTP